MKTVQSIDEMNDVYTVDNVRVAGVIGHGGLFRPFPFTHEGGVIGHDGLLRLFSFIHEGGGGW